MSEKASLPAPAWQPAWNRQPEHFLRRRLTQMELGEEVRDHAERHAQDLLADSSEDLVRQSVLMPEAIFYAAESQAVAMLAVEDPTSPLYDRLLARIKLTSDHRIKLLRACGLRPTKVKGHNAKDAGSLYSAPRVNSPHGQDRDVELGEGSAA